MGETTWSRVRSFLSGGGVVAGEPSGGDASARVQRLTQRATPGAATTTAPVFRDLGTPSGDASADPIRAIDAKTELLRARLDSLEARVREVPLHRDAGVSASSVPAERLDSIADEITKLRDAMNELSRQQAEGRAAAAGLAQHVADIASSLAAVDQRASEAARDVRDVQATADETQRAAEGSASQVEEWIAARERMFGQRLAPLYVLSLIALLAALAAAAMTAFRMME